MTTRGDIIYRNAANTTARLGRGTSGQVLRSDGTDISWTTLTGSDVGLGSVENTALSTWTGSTNITTLGTIGTGTWNATAIGATKGGTGLTSYTAGDLLYASAANILSTIPIAGSAGRCLTSNGTTPAWGSCSSGTGDITDVGSMTSGAAFADLTADDDWLGLGSGAGRIEFDDQTTDEINFLAAMIGIGTQTPLANSLLHIYRSDTQTVPAFVLEQASTGDSSMKYLRGTQNITTGVDQNDNDNFKISNTTTLTGTTYSDANTMMRIHTEAGSQGIVDFNHQSRVRAYRNAALSPAQGAWSKLTFDAEDWDEKSEFTGGTFTALEEGYYQVNARYRITIGGNPGGNSYLGIAIYKNGAAYSYGNRLALSNAAGNGDIPPNNSPNVSDIVYLTAGQTIEIYLWNGSNQAEAITTGSAETYVSIHKLS